MTDVNTPAVRENVSRGLLFAAAAIPLAILGFALIAGLLGGIGGFIAVAVPLVAARLYATGAGAPLGRAGLGPFVVIAAVAVVLGVATGVLASAYNSFTSVGGDGGLANPAYWTTVRHTFSDLDAAFPVLIGLVLGLAGIVVTVRSALGAARATAPALATPAAPPAPPAANAPSPGIILNGEPLDPDKK
jgi:hypothetical protein